jgi:hypothetical protein
MRKLLEKSRRICYVPGVIYLKNTWIVQNRQQKGDAAGNLNDPLFHLFPARQVHNTGTIRVFSTVFRMFS